MKKLDTNKIIEVTNQRIAYDNFLIKEKRRVRLYKTFGIMAFIMVLISSVSIVYAEEIKEVIKNNVIYKYIDKDHIKNRKTHYSYSDNVTSVTEIKTNPVKIKNFTEKDRIESFDDIENKLGIKFLKIKNLKNNYYHVLFRKPGEIDHYNYGFNETEEILIEINNRINEKCIYIKNDAEQKACYDEMKKNYPTKEESKIIMKIKFITQYAKEDTIAYSGSEAAEYPSWQNKTYYSEKLDTTIFIPTNGYAVFAYQNMIYEIRYAKIDGTDKELLNLIESMEY